MPKVSRASVSVDGNPEAGARATLEAVSAPLVVPHPAADPLILVKAKVHADRENVGYRDSL
jgi:hypothetical protein